MAIYDYKKYKVSLHADSKKTQGLRMGDIVRRQYFDGKNLIYSLMCVLSNGIEETINEETNEVESKPYFIGALLDGDAPKTEELLDFARITNLFDQDRSGALYLTGSDDQAPYIDVIDGIGKNASLCWPENIAGNDYIDSETQYVFAGKGDALEVEYIPAINDNCRVAHVKRNSKYYYDTIALQQDFYKYVENPNCVLISYKIKGSKALSCKVSLGYQDGLRIDGEDKISITTDWAYKFHAITVDYSGRHLRRFAIDLSLMEMQSEVWISDFNIILLSSVTNFNDASKMRVGKLSGIVDPVFGQLDGYGGYIQKLFASKSAHISGTLTAGDENGFAATFYAGKIHRNAFLNSMDVDFASTIIIADFTNPTGVGNVYSSQEQMIVTAQNASWYKERVGKQYTFSFWLYATKACNITILQNDKVVDTIYITENEALSWARHKSTFDLQAPASEEDNLLLSLVPQWQGTDGGTLYFVAPQLESGDTATQYQPTDAVLNFTEDYGAWFNRGGIGGTIQNPLLQLNYDGDGSIGTKTGSLLLKTDGSGYFANQNIKWNKVGDVTFGKNVTMSWDNLDNSVKEEIKSKSIRIVGEDIFTLLGDLTGADPTTNPADITLTLEEENIASTSSQRQWYYKDGYDWIKFDGANAKTLTIFPFADYWNNANSLTVKCEVSYLNENYSATFTVKKQYIQGYTIDITSSKGASFKNYDCSTTLTANVYYQGKLVDPEYVAENYTFQWHKYHLPDLENEETGWDSGIDTTKQQITLNYEISGQDVFVCELVLTAGFPYEFPLIF
jgi:hypothetical protein